MKTFLKSAILILLLLIPVSSARSKAGNVFQDYAFPNGVVWNIGGYDSYDVVMRDNVVGVARADYREVDISGQDGYRIHWVQDWTGNGSTFNIDIDTRMLQKDLSVQMTTHIETINGKIWQYTGNFTGKDMSIGAYFPDDPVHHEYNLNRTERYCDADILLFLMRNIPFAEGNFITLTTIDVAQQAFYTPIAKVTGSETIETRRAQYDCWVVDISLPKGNITAWYSKSDTHTLIKARFPDRELLFNHHS